MSGPRALARALALLLGALTLGGCGLGKTVSGWMGSDEPVEPVAPLLDFIPAAEVDRLWSTNVGDGAGKQFLKLAPAVGGERVFSAEVDGDVAAIDFATGRKVWERDTERRVSGGPGVGDGLVVVGTLDGEVLALAEADGSVLWEATVSSEVLASPVIAQGLVMVRTGDGRVFALEADSGKRRWVYDRQVPSLTLRGNSAPVMAEGLVVAGFDSGRLVALDAAAGRPAWETTVGLPSGRTDLDRMVDIDAEPVFEDGRLFVASYQGRVAALDVESGQILWARDISSYAGLEVYGPYLYVTDDQGRLWALDARSGSSIWRMEDLAGRRPSAPAVVGEHVVVGDFEGYVHWMERETGVFVARVRQGSKPILTKPQTVGDVLLVHDAGGGLAAYRVR